jgi:hypothetical protein
MKNDDVKRHPTSDALVQLRKALGKTQQTFAVEILHCAIGTVARYETAFPPEGVALVQLADIAFQHALTDIGNVFLMAFFDEVKSRLAKFPDLSAKEGEGYVFRKLEGWKPISLEQCCMALDSAFNADDPEHRKVADDALTYMQRAAKKVLPPLTYKIRIGYGEAVVAAINASPTADKTPATTTTKPKRKKKQ